jgi:hypothetical protein
LSVFPALRDRRTGSRAVRERQTFILRSYDLGVYIAYQKGGEYIDFTCVFGWGTRIHGD